MLRAEDDQSADSRNIRGLLRLTYLATAIIALSDCRYKDISRDPLPIGPAWTEIRLTSPIHGMFSSKSVFIHLAPTASVVWDTDPVPQDIRQGRSHLIRLSDGSLVAVSAELITLEERTVELKQNGAACPAYHGRCILFFNIDLPRFASIIGIRLRSTAPLTVERVEWGEGEPK